MEGYCAFVVNHRADEMFLRSIRILELHAVNVYPSVASLPKSLPMLRPTHDKLLDVARLNDTRITQPNQLSERRHIRENESVG